MEVLNDIEARTQHRRVSITMNATLKEVPRCVNFMLGYSHVDGLFFTMCFFVISSCIPSLVYFFCASVDRKVMVRRFMSQHMRGDTIIQYSLVGAEHSQHAVSVPSGAMYKSWYSAVKKGELQIVP